MERREAWSVHSGAFCVPEGLHAPRHAETRHRTAWKGWLSVMSATILLLFGLFVAIIILATIATRLHIPYAILLVLGGLFLGFVPGLPRIMLDPELILVVFLPPLIYSSSWLTSWREFH